jgi:hypothetical protein
MMQQGCRMQAAAKQHVSGAPGESRVVGTCLGAILVCLGALSIVPELWLVFQRGAKQGIQLLSTGMSLMMWQAMWTCNMSL